MQREELLAMMISVSAPAPKLDEWDRVLSIYAGYLEGVASKLSERELGNFIGAGAMFYRTLCQADAYRREAVWGGRKKDG
ncbi:DNA-3-methyladenine glycosylase [Achromobacter spanius]|uniref:DNA-3-methyladenine glycosylase n=1 Tax=Achromobacter spanius TaxID=217203 RepID=UPI003207F3D7